MTRAFTAGLFLLAVGALALRLPQLDRRPMHTDESVHAIKFRGLWDDGVYRYDPHEYHGPALYYATLPIAWLHPARNFAEATETLLRLVPALFGLGLMLLLLLTRDALGNPATLWAAGLTAVSPALVFYSRYYIHEVPFVFFTFLLLAALWRYSQAPHLGWCLAAGGAVGLMHATKETFVFNLAAIGGAGILTLAWTRVVEGRRPDLARWLNPWHLGVVGAAAALVSVVLFSSFFTNPDGPLDSLRTYGPWLKRAEGHSPHVHPWHYYLGLLAWHQRGRAPAFSEALILCLAAVGLIAALARKELPGVHLGWARFLGFYILGLTGIYSVLPYKTPWCLLGFLHGMILLAGLGAVVLIRTGRTLFGRSFGLALLLAASGQLGVQAWRASFPYCDRQENPYVYAHTLSDVLDLADKVEALSRVHPQGHAMSVELIAPNHDYWPLPWYLRRFREVGGWAEVPDPPKAPILIASPALAKPLQAKLGDTYEPVGFFGLRPSVFLNLYVQRDLWQSYLRRAANRE
jgi:uncharacterized protein (TIGR03663 family)